MILTMFLPHSLVVIKSRMVIEELDESIYWLEMLIELKYFTFEKLSKLISDGNEILAILSKSRKNTYK